MTQPIHTIPANEDGIEINIFANIDGLRLNVVASDVDAGQMITCKIVSGDLSTAIGIAEAMLAPSLINIPV